MKTFEEELYETLANLVCDFNSGGLMSSKEALLPEIKLITSAHQAEMDRVVEEITKETPCDWRCVIASKMAAPHQPDHQTELRVLKETSARYKAIKEGK